MSPRKTRKGRGRARQDSIHGHAPKGGKPHQKPRYDPEEAAREKPDWDAGRPGSSASSGGFEFRDRTGRVHYRRGPGGGGEGGGKRFDRSERRPAPLPKRKEFEISVPASDGTTRKLKGTVDKNRKGFGFLAFENREIEDAFIPPRDAEGLFHGDRVEVTINTRGEVIDIRVIEHRFRELVGRFTPMPSKAGLGGWVVYERKRAREEVYVPEMKLRAGAGDWVKARLEFHTEGPYRVSAVVTEVYGPELPASADIGMVAAEYSLEEEHPADAEAEARGFILNVDQVLRGDPRNGQPPRVDLRNVPFITIDGETARDFDDAVYVEREGTDRFVLWVAIADVSHYVTDGSALDRSARSRGTSVYFPERAFHMLPRALSENLCSLKPDEPRLAMVARMVYDRQARRHETELMEALIQSRRRATYNQIEAEWQSHRGAKGWEFTPHFELYQAIRKMRSSRGSIDFDLPEAEVKVDPQGVPISITHRPRLDAHRLIEEFMIAANEGVTEWIMKRRWPFVYRVHDEPAAQALEKFERLAANMGITFAVRGGQDLTSSLADLVRRLDGHPAQELLNMALLRSMRQAVYSALHSTHFGLASPGYTHFTSPIRRYPDLIVHRMLRRALRTEKGLLQRPGNKELDALQIELEEICEHCSYRERIASTAERESIKLKQVRAVIPKLGDEFDGKVVGMTENGLFVQINDPYVEGMLSRDSLTDDFYQFNEERMIFYGTRKRRTFRIGDMIRVRAVRADIDLRQIDFALIGAGGEAEEHAGKGRGRGKVVGDDFESRESHGSRGRQPRDAGKKFPGGKRGPRGGGGRGGRR